MKTVVQELIYFVKSENYNNLSDALKEEWVKHFLEKEKFQNKVNG